VLLKAAYVLGRLSASGKTAAELLVLGLLAVGRFDCLSAAEGVRDAAADLCCSDSCFMPPAWESATGMLL
jgi:hypothetical protein